VLLKGNFTLDGALSIPSYSVLDLSDAVLMVSSTLNLAGNPIITNSAPSSGNTEIEILGGFLNSNYPTNTNNNYGIYLNNSTNSRIKDVTLTQFKGYGIKFNLVDNSEILNNHLTSSSDDVARTWIQLSDSDDNLIEHNTVIDGIIEVSSLDSLVYCHRNQILYNKVWASNIRGMIRIYTNATDTTVQGNYIQAKSAGIYGIACKNLKLLENHLWGVGAISADDLISLAYIDGLLVDGNELYDPSQNGINLDNPVGTLNADVRIVNNYVENSRFGSSIRVQGASGGSNISCIIANNEMKIATGHLIDVQNIVGVVIDGNVGYSNGTHCNYGIEVDTCDMAIISNNRIWNITEDWWSPAIELDSSNYVLVVGNNVAYSGTGISLGDSDNCTISINVMRFCSSRALNIGADCNYTWAMGNDLRTNTDDVADQGTDTIWTDNLDRLGGFHNSTAPDV